MKQLLVIGFVVVCALATVPICTSNGYWGVIDGVHDYMYYECNAPFYEGWKSCPSNTRCNAGFFHEIPCGASSICGNGIVEFGEECDGGIGCFNCKCTNGYKCNNPATPYCVPSGNPNPTCGTNGYWCVKDGVHDDMYYQCNYPYTEGYVLCPTNYTCKASGFYYDYPCISKISSVCGNGLIEFGEECDGGRGCNSRCQCRSGFEPTNPISVNCQCEPRDSCEDFDYECGIHDNGCRNVSCGVCRTGYKCENHRCVVDYCGNGFIDFGEECDGGVGCCNCKCVNGSVPTSPISVNCTIVQDCNCVPTRTCASENAACGQIYNGCEVINCGTCIAGRTCSSNTCTLAFCGNGVINGEEQCDGGLGCTSTCVCDIGYVPTVPRSTSCQPDGCIPTAVCGAIQCGTIFDGCEEISCGTCDAQSFCSDGQCVPSITCETFDIQCGSFFNGTEVLDCGVCPTGTVCNEQSLCVVEPITCLQAGIECGSFFNGVTVISCGPCFSGEICELGLCVAL